MKNDRVLVRQTAIDIARQAFPDLSEDDISIIAFDQF